MTLERQRLVRYAYPDAMMDLAIALSLRCEKRTVANSLAIPLSTLYRWCEQYRRNQSRFKRVAKVQSRPALLELIEECQSNGFQFGDDLNVLVKEFEVTNQLYAETNDDSTSTAQEHFCNGAVQNSVDEQRRFESERNRTSTNSRLGIASARAWIDSHYYCKLSCDALAHSIGITKWHFIRAFRAEFGVSPYQYLTSVRIQRAKYLLSTTTNSLEAVAIAVGIDTLSSLCRAFQKIEGVSLSSYFRGVRLGSPISSTRARSVESSARKMSLRAGIRA